jgi:hypothetical protein
MSEAEEGGWMPIYKITDAEDKSYGGCRWGENVTHTADGEGELCTEHWIHAYTDPLLAVMMNPVHGDYALASAHLWECEGVVGKDDGTKLGCTSLTTLKRIELPAVTTEQRLRFGILCAREVCHENSFIAWSDAWLSGRDRSEAAAWAAAEAWAAWAAEAARAAAEAWAAEAARAAAAAAAAEA